jgi:hypothetical protein
MFEGSSLTTAVSPRAAILGAAALNRRLTVYAGAGLSAAIPTSLPGAALLAHDLFTVLSRVVNLTGVDEWDLLAVADAVALDPSGPRMLHDALKRVADFDGATPNYAHQVLALLISEGAITALEANYDSCIERAGQPEHIPVVVDNTDRLDMDKGALLKVHGCITRPSTMLVTTAELAGAPFFARAELTARLSVDEVAFIGLGSPADYVRKSVTDFVDHVPTGALTVVDPKIGDWEASDWNEIVPGLAPEQRVAVGAEHFCDEILRFYVSEIWRLLRQKVSELDADHPQRAGAEAIASLMETRNAVWVMRWLRSVAWKFGVGKSVVNSSRVLQGTLALAMLTSGQSLELRGKALVKLPGSGTNVMLIAADHAPNGGVLAIEAERRVADARAEGRVNDGETVVVLCSGHSGSLGPAEILLARGSKLSDLFDAPNFGALSGNLIGEADADHLIDSVTSGAFIVIAGDTLIDVA